MSTLREILARAEEVCANATPGPYAHRGQGVYVALLQITNDEIKDWVSAPRATSMAANRDTAEFLVLSRTLMAPLLAVARAAETHVRQGGMKNAQVLSDALSALATVRISP